MVQLYAGALTYRLLMERRMMQLTITMVLMVVMMMIIIMAMMMIKFISSYPDRPLLGLDEPGREGKTQDK